MFAGSGFTPTHYKLWGIETTQGEGVVSSGTAAWVAFPAGGAADAYLSSSDTYPQNASVKFKNAGEAETDVFQSNDVTFNFTENVVNPSVEWGTVFSSVGFDTTTSNTLVSTDYSTEVELDKANITQLRFSETDFSGLRIDANTIYISPSSELGRLISMENDSFVSVSKQFGDSEVRMITVSDGSGWVTLTAFDGEIKTTLSGTDTTRIANAVWDEGTDTMSFDAYQFSTYGFTTIDTVEFTTDSQEGAYVGETASFRVLVKDTNGEEVESAPVTVQATGDTIGTIQESMPVTTNGQGLAEFTVPATSEGIAYYSATVSGGYASTVDHSLFAINMPATQRSLLTQLEQIFKTETYDDTVSGTNTIAVAEPSSPTASGLGDSVIEHDMNVLRTIMKQVKGTDDWFTDPGNYFDPKNTDVVDVENAEFSLAAIKNNTLDANTALLAVDESNSGSGYSVSVGTDGILVNNTTRYATHTDRTGLPIYASTTNSGSYYDQGGIDRVVTIDLIDMDNGSEFRDTNGDIIYGKFHDGADNSGTGDGTDVYIKFYTDAGEYTTISGDPSTVMAVYPYRKVLSDMEEYEWVRTTFVSSWEGDAEIVEDISNLWSYTGAADGESDPDWTVISGSPIVDSSHTSLVEAINALNDDIGIRDWTLTPPDSVLTDGESVTASLDALDIGIKSLADNSAANIGDIYLEVVASGVDIDTPHTLPGSLVYTPDSTSGQEGKNLDVYLNGLLLSADTGVSGINYDRDYAESSTTQITFHSYIYENTNLTYLVRQ
ncbi:MAG: hypothetical protein DRQ47_04180 [Gammaproteobacteria bacterium]|nr:MAG: hypothetical protein DRQ47_04180 [Gammaproteobacteria bacterium]